MAHWKSGQEPEPEDGNARDIERAAQTRRWLRGLVSRQAAHDPLCGMLADLELSASVFYLGMDYDDDFDDIDEMGPF